MWFWRILTLTLSFTGSLALIKLPEPSGVQFDSINFNYILRWMQKGPEETVYDVEYLIYGETWKNKPECHHIAARNCDLTNEIVQENNWYYARVMAISKNANSTWSLSERFCPLDKTIIAAPTVEYTVGERSITVLIHPPQIPPKQGVQRSIRDIFATVEYKVQLNQSLTNKMVFCALNESAHFKIESLEPNTEYCANVQLHLKKGIFSKMSQPAHFCIQTLQERTLTIVLLMGFVIFGAVITGIFCCMANTYIKHRRTLPQSLNLDQIVLHKRALLKESSPTQQLVTSHRKNIFQFEQIICLDNIDLLKCDSNEKEDKEHTLTTRPNSYASQIHTRTLQTELRSNSPSKPPELESPSPYCPQATNYMSNSTCSRQSSSQAPTQSYATILYPTSQSSSKLNIEPGLSNGQEEKPVLLPSFLSLLEEQQNNWKVNQPKEIPLLSSLKDTKQINLSLLLYGGQIDNQSFLSLLKDEVDFSYLHSDRMDDQPIKVPVTEVLQTNLKDGQLVKAVPLLEEETFTELLHMKPEWEDQYKEQLLISQSSMQEGQQTDGLFLQTFQKNAAMEDCKFLEDWEVQVHMAE